MSTRHDTIGAKRLKDNNNRKGGVGLMSLYLKRMKKLDDGNVEFNLSKEMMPMQPQVTYLPHCPCEG